MHNNLTVLVLNTINSNKVPSGIKKGHHLVAYPWNMTLLLVVRERKPGSNYNERVIERHRTMRKIIVTGK